MSRAVWLAAAIAVCARFPSALWPLRPDEAGFLLVARAWEPQPDSLYGPYFVDRPPLVIALARYADALGGPYFHRVIGAIGCGLLVLALAAAADEVARACGVDDERARRRVGAWTAAVAAALVSNALVDPVSVKGELLGIPLVAGACWLALRAVRLGSAPVAAASGLLGCLAVGLKQNMVGGLVLAFVLVVGHLVTGRLDRVTALRLTLGGLAGVAVPVVVTIGWTLAAGVDLSTLSYTVVAFRSDASEVIAAQDSTSPDRRSVELLWIATASGMLLVLAWFVALLPRLARRAPVLTLAVATMLAVDIAGVVLSGSYWRPYLFVPIPALALAVALVTSCGIRRTRAAVVATTVAVGAVVASAVASVASWSAAWWEGMVPHEYRAGEAIRAEAGPDDTLLVYGGRADIQWAADLPSPYAHLWSLPMRTLDPQLDDLDALLTGPDAPTWVVEAARINAWSELGTRPIERTLLHRYEFVVTACDTYRIYHLADADDVPVTLDVDCDPWRGLAPVP